MTMAAIMPALQNPKCYTCKKTFSKMEYMHTHMKNVHGESDHERLERFTQTLKSVVNQKPVKENNKVTLSEY